MILLLSHRVLISNKCAQCQYLLFQFCPASEPGFRGLPKNIKSNDNFFIMWIMLIVLNGIVKPIKWSTGYTMLRFQNFTDLCLEIEAFWMLTIRGTCVVCRIMLWTWGQFGNVCITTLDPAWKEFGYNEYAVTMSVFISSQKIGFIEH